MSVKHSPFLIPRLIFLAFIFMNGYLISQAEIVISKYFLIFSAAIFTIFFTKELKTDLVKKSPDFLQLQENLNEAQKIIRQKSYGIFRYIGREKSIGIDNSSHISLYELAESPLIWVLCFFLAVIPYFTPAAYLGIDENNFYAMLKLFLLSIFQFLMFNVFFSGLFLSISKLFKGEAK